MSTRTIIFVLSLFTFLSFHHKAVSEDFNFKEVVYSPEGTTFQLFAPSTAKKVVLRIYDGDQTVCAQPRLKKHMKPRGKNLWGLAVSGDLKGCFYTFEVFTPQSNGETPGVFAKAVGINGRRGAIISLRDTDPLDWSLDQRPPLKSYADLVVYELHHRDFSISPTSGAENKGKFLALTEPRSIQHLRELGVNAVHILPSFDYASVDETRLNEPQYNWGYDPLNYNVPEGSYSTDPYSPTVRIKEFKQMVQSLHRAGIRVILDVVYNHTFDIQGSGFQRTYPGYYYRKNADGTYSDGSGCGNETASEQPMMRKFIVNSVKYWANEYHIDGFRFDLMGVHDIETMSEVRAELSKIDPSIFIYGEGWSAGKCAYPTEKLAMKANISRLNGIAAFSDELRDALRGPFSDNQKGAFLAGISGNEESIKAGIAGLTAHSQVDYGKVNYSNRPWAAQPTQMISYVSCHDDMCLTDRLKTSIPDISIDEIIRLDLLAQTTVFTSQGIPFVFCGEEMLRSKKGVHNSYQSPDSINALDWDNLQRYPQVFDYYKKLIRLRKNHAAFRLGDAKAINDHLVFFETRPCLVGFMLKNHAGGDAWNDIMVFLNGNKEPREVKIPGGKYTIVCQNGVISEGGLGEINGPDITVAPQSALIIHN